MQVIYVAIILFGILASLPLQWAEANGCPSFLLTATKSYRIQNPQSIDTKWLGGHGLGGTVASDYDESIFDHSVSLEKPDLKQAKEFGARMVIRKKSGRGWYSDHGPFGNAMQGDPRSPFLILDRELAVVLGYQMWDQNTVVFPTAERLNWGISLVNSWLEAEGKLPFRYSFYAQGSDTESTFRKRFRKAQLPISENSENPRLSDELAIHDHVYHVTELYEPLEIQHRTLTMERFFSSYLKFVKKTVSEEDYHLEEKEINSRLDAIVANVNSVLYRATMKDSLEGGGRIGLSERAGESLSLLRLTDFDHEYFSTLKYWEAFEKSRATRIERFQEDFDMMPGAYMTGDVLTHLILQRRREVSSLVRKRIRGLKTTNSFN